MAAEHGGVVGSERNETSNSRWRRRATTADEIIPLLPNFTCSGSLTLLTSSQAASSCGHGGSHVQGGWVLRAEESPPYRLSRSAWPEMWVERNRHYYGSCADATSGTNGAGEYVWQEPGCRLPSFREASDDLCSLLCGRRVVIAGDSTTLQFFQSLTFILHGNITAWSNAGSRFLGRRDRDDHGGLYLSRVKDQHGSTLCAQWSRNPATACVPCCNLSFS